MINNIFFKNRWVLLIYLKIRCTFTWLMTNICNYIISSFTKWYAFYEYNYNNISYIIPKSVKHLISLNNGKFFSIPNKFCNNNSKPIYIISQIGSITTKE